jgi:hypothetical protein
LLPPLLVVSSSLFSALFPLQYWDQYPQDKEYGEHREEASTEPEPNRYGYDETKHHQQGVKNHPWSRILVNEYNVARVSDTASTLKKPMLNTYQTATPTINANNSTNGYFANAAPILDSQKRPFILSTGLFKIPIIR